MQRLKQLMVSLTAGTVLLLIMVGLPLGLVAMVGWPLPSAFGGTAALTTAIEQRNIAAEVVINTLAVVVWVLWAQLLWALVWELFVNGRRLARGLRSRPAPLVAAPLNALAVRLVSGLLAASVVATTAMTSLSLPTTPTLAITSGIQANGIGADGVAADGVGADGVGADGVAADGREQAAIAADRLSAGRRGSSASDRLAVGVDGGPKWLVKDGDSLWSIAETTFGDGARSAEVLNLNPDVVSARSVRPGMVLLMPLGAPVPQDRVPPVEHLPAIDIEIEPGDNLWDLSEHRLGRVMTEPGPAAVADHVAEVLQENTDQIDHPDLIHPGQVFAFPAVGVDLPAVTIPAPETEKAAEPDGSAAERVARPGHGSEPELPIGTPGDIRSVPEVQEPVGEAADEHDDADTTPVGAPLVLGVAGAFLAAGVLDLARRRWRYRMSHRSSGTMPRVPDPALGSIHHALHREADDETRRWVHEAIGSLTLRPVWEGEQLAQPAVVRVGANSLDAEFDAADPMAAPLPWTTDDDGRNWRLDRSTSLDELGPQPDGTPLPTLVTIGTDLMVNLEAMGVVGIEGSGTDPMALVRSIVHELATSPAAGSIDIRSTVPIVGAGSYDLVRLQSPTELAVELPSWLDDVDGELARTSSSNAYGHRLVTDLDPIGPVVVVSDEAGCRSMPGVMEYARRRSLPLAVVMVGPVGSTGAENLIKLGRATARLEPAGIDFEPQLLSAEAARELGHLLDEVAADDEEPLVTSVELSASVTVIRRGGAYPAPIEPPIRPIVQADAGSTQAGAAPTQTDEQLEAHIEGDPDLDDSGSADFGSADFGAADSGAADVEPVSPGSAQSDGTAEGGEQEDAQITIKVLGDVQAEGASQEMTSQQLSLVCYLACNGSSSREALIDALWDGQVISKSRFPNLLAETRARIGRHHFPEARDGRYELRSVGTDLARFERQVLSAQRQDVDAAAATLAEALELVRGVPFTPPSRRFWSWVGEHSHVAARVESMIADTAARLARIEQERGNAEGARVACERGLMASPTDETLVVVLTEVYLELGRPGLARRLVDSWEDRVSQMDCGEPSDEPRKRLAG